MIGSVSTKASTSLPLDILQKVLSHPSQMASLGILSEYVSEVSGGNFWGIILLYDGDKKCLVPGSMPNIPARPLEKHNEVPVAADHPISGRAAYFKETLFIPDTMNEPYCDRYRDLLQELKIFSSLSIPILSSDRDLLGVFSFYFSHAATDWPEQTPLLKALAGLAGVILERRSLEAQRQDNIEKLRASQERLNLALRSQKMGVWDADLITGKMLWDDTMFEIFGKSREEASGTLKDWEEAIHPGDHEYVMQIVDAVLHGQTNYNHEYRIIRRGEVRHIAAVGILLHDETGKAIRLTGLNWDITDKVLASQKIEQERAKSVAAAKMAVLGEMASGVAHEINNPLTIILNRANQLKDRILKQPEIDRSLARQEVEKIEATVERIAKIIRGLRAFSRNSDSDPMISCDWNSILDECLELCHERLKKFGVALHLKGLPYQVALRCRPSQISQVLLNLLNNSFDAISSSPHPWIEIKVTQDHGVLRIRITDSGPGIPKTISQKVMQPFFTTKEVGKGTGLGLSISKGIIEDHNGHLSLDTENPHTSFVIELPAEEITSPTQRSTRPLEYRL
ncbi:MAG: hypothetical protein COT73_12080 [Bdellovibrio sp. CG10_big_fil_rev_8_21_14_0_10_47_8]|nr:MAG: hypothetical protein COT73_12080 [Bdellovibrio sp. CG10_big_fil_rev_8_21_14_0_10_47_8]